MNLFPIRPALFQPGPTPSTVRLVTASIGDIERYTHSISRRGGFEAATVEFACDLDDALVWLDQLMAAAVMYGPWAETVWEGVLTGVTVRAGDETIDLSMESLASAVRVRFSGSGVEGRTEFATSAASIARYGRKEYVHSGSDTNIVGAEARRAAILAERATPKARRASTIRTGSIREAVGVTLSFTGWYYLLDWLFTESTTAGTAVTTTQVLSLLTAYNAVNNFFDLTDTTQIAASGQSDLQAIEEDTTYRQAIEDRLSTGTSGQQQQAWGVYEGRRFRVGTWAGATPSAITYQRWLGDGRLFTAAGGEVDPWNARPDAMYQVVDLLDVAPEATAQDARARYYVERVSCQVEAGSWSVTLEPSHLTNLDAMLARVR
jgi:hypothetical protein